MSSFSSLIVEPDVLTDESELTDVLIDLLTDELSAENPYETCDDDELTNNAEQTTVDDEPEEAEEILSPAQVRERCKSVFRFARLHRYPLSRYFGSHVT
jgi:hypothetical protein